AEDDDLAANVLYRLGRVFLHREAAREALILFQRGRATIGKSGQPLTTAILCCNEAWAHALLGDADRAVALLGETVDQFTSADLANAAPWVRFFDAVDLQAMIGTVH